MIRSCPVRNRRRHHLHAHRSEGVSAAMIALAILAGTITSGATQAAPDEALARTLENVILSSSDFDPSVRNLMAKAAMEAAQALPARSEAETARLGQDLAVAIRMRAWPFYLAKDFGTLESGRAWLSDAVRIIVKQTAQIRLPDEGEMAELRAMPGEIASGVRAYTEHFLAAWSPEHRAAVNDFVRKELQARAPLFGNAFNPHFLRPCRPNDGGPPRTMRDLVLEALLQHESRWTHLAQVPEGHDPDPSRVSMHLVGMALTVAMGICQDEERRRLIPPEALFERQSKLEDRVREIRRRDQALELSDWHMTDNQSAAAPTNPRSALTARAGILSHDEAVERAFEGSGIQVVHGTAIMPRSWSPPWRALMSGWSRSRGGVPR